MLKGDYGKKSFINPITKLVLLVTLPAFLMGGLGGTDAEIFTLIFPLVSLFLLFISKNFKAGIIGLLVYISVIIAWSVLSSGSGGIFHIMLFIVVGIVTGLFLCALMSVYVISSTTASEFITGMKKLFIPDVVTIPMSVIFRFFPTVKEEIQAINKAMKMRGIRFTAKELAAEFGVSETSLKNYFRGVYGCGYAEFQQNLRLKRAANLLAQTDKKVIDIALRVGYKSQPKFGAAFKEQYKVSPLEYRRRCKFESKTEGDNNVLGKR